MSLRRNLLLAEPEPEALADAIKTICVPISKILLQSMQATRKRDIDPEGSSIIEVCIAFNRVYPSLLRGLECIQQHTSIDNDQYTVPAVSDAVKVFQAFLGRLHKSALDEFARREHEIKSKKRAASPRPEGTSPTSEEDLAKAKKMTQILLRMMTALNVTVDAHCQLLEGYLCALLDHVGSSLSFLVFADPNESHKKQSGLLPPSGLLDSVHLNAKSATGATTIEGPYVIFVLRKGVEFLLENAPRMSEKSQADFTLSHLNESNSASGNDLRRQIEKTLQNTLLRGAFGDDDDLFYNSLRRDEGEEADLEKMMKDVKTKESAEWFIGELWEHLGWDILSGRKGI